MLLFSVIGVVVGDVQAAAGNSKDIELELDLKNV